ncbi:MAG: hypothetical protein AAF297_08570 [Planctomycetota bacterium]
MLKSALFQRPALSLAAVAASMSAGLGACGSQYNNHTSKHRSAVVFHLSAQDIDTLDIHTKKGRTDIAAHGQPWPDWAAGEIETEPSENPSEVVVIAVLQSNERKRLEGATLEPSVDGGAVVLRAEWPWQINDDNGDGVEYAIRLPRVENVTLDSSFGDFVVRGAHGEVDADLGFGDAMLHAQHGPAQIDAGFGDIRVEFATDGVDHGAERSNLDSGFGDIIALAVPAGLRADTGFGDIRVELTDDNAGPVRADSGFGDVKIVGGPALRAWQDGQANKGTRVSSGFGNAVVTIREAE